MFKFTIVVVFGDEAVYHHEHVVTLLFIHGFRTLAVFIKLLLEKLGSNLDEFLIDDIFILIHFEFCVNQTQE
jgi:hypothetical protein